VTVWIFMQQVAQVRRRLVGGREGENHDGKANLERGRNDE
jgi:hypothetical protein